VEYTFRVLLKNRSFSLMAVIILALGIGANTAIFSVVNAVLLRPLPFDEPERLVQIWHTPPAEHFPGMRTFSVSPANFLDWKSRSRSFESMAAFGYRSLSFGGRGRPEAVVASSVSPEFLAVLRARPALGRGFLPEENQPGRGQVVLLGHDFWRTRLGGDPDVVGRTVALDGQAFLVAGVMGPEFRFPDEARVWVPLAWTDAERAVRGIHDFLVIGRLNPGVEVGRAQAELDTISTRLERQYPEDDKGWGAAVVNLREQIVGDVRPALMVLLGAVAFVLLIACANVANLVLARTLGRSKEIAIRSALGASRARVLRQVLSETLLLAVAGGAVGLLAAHWGVGLIVNFLAGKLPRSLEIAIDAPVLAFTVMISVIAGLLAGTASALRLTRAGADLNHALKQGLGRGGSDSGGQRVRASLVVAEVALSLVLLSGAGLMIRSLWLLRSVDAGFDARDVLTATLAIPENRYALPSQQNGFYEQVLEGVRALPGVEVAGAVADLPLTGGSTQPIAIEGRAQVPMSEQPEVAVREITPDYLKTMRIPVLSGRDVDASDVAERPGVVLVSESLARRFWPGESPVGKRLILTFYPDKVREVVGVVGDVKQRGLDVAEPVSTLYAPLAQQPRPYMALAVRTTLPPRSLVSAVTDAVRRVDPEQPLEDVRTLEELVGVSLSHQRFNMLLLAVFAGLAMLLAAVGIYSVLSYSVKRRVREIGIRMALGAQTGDVLRMVVLEGMKPTALGLAIGLAGSLALAPALASLIYGVRPTDAATFATVSALLAGVGFLASLIPGYRATRVDPIVTLRDE